MELEELTEREDAFLEGMDADQSAGPDTETEPTPDVDSASSGEAGDAEETDPEDCEEADGGADEEPGRRWTLKHLDETRDVDETELVTLAQKGLDYDRIRARCDDARPVLELAETFARRLGMTVPEYVAFARRQTGDGGEDQRRRAEVEDFARRFPEAARDPDAIPPAVWQAVDEGASLSLAYALHALEEAEHRAGDALAQSRSYAQNRMNAQRSTGSMGSAGEDRRGGDPFLEGWNA